MKTNDRESKIQESRYLVSFMNLKAMTAAMICNIMEIISAISLIIEENLWYKNRS